MTLLVADEQYLDPKVAAARLGVHYTHLLRLVRENRIRRSPLNSRYVDAESLEKYHLNNRPGSSSQEVDAQTAADILGCSRRHIPELIRTKVLEGRVVPPANGGAWVLRTALETLDRGAFAVLVGIRIRPPEGWATSADIREELGGISRSTLRALVRKGAVECWSPSPLNIWYRHAST